MERPLRVKILGEDVVMTITDTRIVPTENGYQEVALITSRGEILCRYYPAEGADRAAIMVGGTGGDFDSPAKDLYPVLAEDLATKGIASLRVRYRDPNNLVEGALDVLAGLRFLKSQGVAKAALIGHSLGGAVVIQAAAKSSIVTTLVTLSTQSNGADALTELKEGVSSLFIHGGKDRELPPRCSSYAYYIAKEPKEFIIHDDATHSLDEVAGEVYDEVRTWLLGNLK
jgi:alpha/beta superfamily hydrolase